MNSAPPNARVTREPQPGSIIHAGYGTQVSSWAFASNLKKKLRRLSLGASVELSSAMTSDIDRLRV